MFALRPRGATVRTTPWLWLERDDPPRQGNPDTSISETVEKLPPLTRQRMPHGAGRLRSAPRTNQPRAHYVDQDSFERYRLAAERGRHAPQLSPHHRRD